MKKQNKIKKGIVYNSVGSMIYLFCQWLITFIVVWLSGYGTAGLLALSMSVTNTFSVISTFNMRNYQASDMNRRYSEKTYLFTRIITIFVALFITLIYSFIKKFSFMEICCINVFMLYKMTEAFVDVLHGSIQKKWYFNIIGISYAARGIISIVSFSLILFITNNLLLSLLVMTFAVVIFIVFFDIRNYKNIIKDCGSFCFRSMFSLLLISLPLVIYGIIANCIAMNPRIFINQKFGDVILGYYASVATPALIIQVAASFIFNPLITLFAEYYDIKDMKNFYRTLIKVLIAVILIGVVGLFVSTFFGEFLLKLLYGPLIVKYSYLLNGVVIVSILTAFIWFLGMILTVVRNYFSLLLGSLISLIVCLILTPVFIDKYYLNGINYVLIVSYLIQSIIYFGSILLIKTNYIKGKNKIIYVRSTSIVNDSRASKEINTLLKNDFNVLIFGWDRDKRIKDYKDLKINDRKINAKFFKYKCEYGANLKTFFGLVFFQVWLFVKLFINRNKFEYIHACDFDCGFVSSLICKMFDKKLVYDMYDYYSESRDMSPKLAKVIKKMEDNIIDYAYASIICAEWRKKQIKDAHPKQLIVIHNTPDCYKISSSKIIKSNSKKRKIVYVGILQENRLIMEIVNELKENDNYELHIGGFGIYEQEIKRLAQNYKNIYYYGSLKYSDVLSLERDCDLLFATYNPKIKNHRYSAPNKVYEAMALEKPVIVCKNTGVDKMVISEDIGRVIDYDAKDFVKKIDEIFKDYKTVNRIVSNERKLYKNKYSWEIMEKKLISVYNK